MRHVETVPVIVGDHLVEEGLDGAGIRLRVGRGALREFLGHFGQHLAERDFRLVGVNGDIGQGAHFRVGAELLAVPRLERLGDDAVAPLGNVCKQSVFSGNGENFGQISFFHLV